MGARLGKRYADQVRLSFRPPPCHRTRPTEVDNSIWCRDCSRWKRRRSVARKDPIGYGSGDAMTDAFANQFANVSTLRIRGRHDGRLTVTWRLACFVCVGGVKVATAATRNGTTEGPIGPDFPPDPPSIITH